MIGAFVLLMRVCAGITFDPVAVTPVTPLAAEVQLNIAPGVALVIFTAAEVDPEQIV